MTAYKVVGEKESIKFTPSQEIAINGLIDFIDKPFDKTKYIMALSGAGGTGKTFSTKHVIDNCKWSNSLIKCCAPTHKACRVLSKALNNKKVITIQSMLGMRLDVDIENYDPEQPKFAPIGRIKLVDRDDYTKVLIVDEASMLNYKLIYRINSLCKEHEIKVIYIGDAYQLPPVNEKISAAFTIASKVYHLTEIVRQEENNTIKILLDILRKDIRKGTYDFFNYITKNPENVVDDKGYIVCNNMSFDYMVEQCFSDKDFESNVNKYRIIAYTNAKVSYWNNVVRNSIIKDAERGILTKNDLLMSYTTITNEYMDIIINNSDDYIIKNIGEYYDSEYNFKSYLVQFINVDTGIVTPKICVIDHSDRNTFIKYYKTIIELINAAKNASSSARVACWKKYYDFKRKYLIATNIINNNNGKIMFSRDIDYGFSLTSHKSQGSTYNTVLVDVNDIVFNKRGIIYTNQDELLRRLYVACSRPSNKLVMLYGR